MISHCKNSKVGLSCRDLACTEFLSHSLVLKCVSQREILLWLFGRTRILFIITGLGRQMNALPHRLTSPGRKSIMVALG